MVASRLTYATLSMTEDATGQGCHPLNGARLYKLPLHQAGARYTLRKVAWPDKFKTGPIDKYHDSSDPEEFIQVYHTVIEAVGGDDRV
jgi:hypothetical protein